MTRQRPAAPIRGNSNFSRCILTMLVFCLGNRGQAADPPKPVELPVGDEKVFSIAFSPNGKQFAVGTGGRSPTVKIFDLASNKEVRDFPCPGRGAAFSVAFDPENSLIAIADYNLAVNVHKLADGSEVASLPGDPDRKKYRQARRVAFLPGGKCLVVGYSTGEVFIWDLNTKSVTVKFDHGNEISALAVSNDGKQIATGTTFGLRVWNAADGKQLVAVDKKSSNEYQVQAIGFSPDGKSVATADSPGFVRILSTAEGQEISSYKMESVGKETTISGIAVSSNGKSLIVPGLVSGQNPDRPRVLTEGIVILDASNARPKSFLPTGSARMMVLSPDGQTVAISTGDSGDGVLLYKLKAAQSLKGDGK